MANPEYQSIETCLTANEARKINKSNELRMVLQTIESNAKCGRFSIHYTKAIEDKTVKKLQELGYEIKTERQEFNHTKIGGEKFYNVNIISWGIDQQETKQRLS